LIIKTGALGDVLRTTTLLHPLRRQFPQAHITWLTAKGAMPLLADNKMIDELVAMGAANVKVCLDKQYDLLINLEKEAEPLVLAGAVQAAQKAGYSPTPWGAAAVYNSEADYGLLLGINDDLKFYRNKKAYPEIIAEMAGLEYKRDPYVLELSPKSRDRLGAVKNLISERSNESRGPVIGLNSGCGSVFRTKQWTLDGWATLAQELIASHPGRVLLTGGEAERELNAEIMARVPGLIDTGNDNPLEEFFGIIEACDVVVTSDSLGMHVAIARQKRTVALFGSTSHHEIDLYDRGEKVITSFACSPCYLKTCDKAPTCMEAMSANTVAEAVHRQVKAITDCFQNA